MAKFIPKRKPISAPRIMVLGFAGLILLGALLLMLPISSAQNEFTPFLDALFTSTTATCPNCRIAIKMLDEAGIPYEKVLAEDVPELAAKLGIHQAPTLVSGGQLYTGAGAIKKFISQ